MHPFATYYQSHSNKVLQLALFMKQTTVRAPLEPALDLKLLSIKKLRTLDPKIEEFYCLVHKLFLTLTALQYKPQWKMG